MRKLHVDPLISLYASLNRWGAFEVPILRSFFVHSYFFYKRHFEDPFATLVSRHRDLFSRGHLLDVGANIGYTAVVFAPAIKPGHRVFAFEPEMENFRRLSENLKTFGVEDRVIAQRAAVGANDGTIDIWLNKRHPGDHRTVTDTFRGRIAQNESTQSVPLVSIDAFAERNHISNQIGFIKIDVQGYETEICRGMQRTLAVNPGVTVAVEYAPREMKELGFATETLINFFIERGFILYELRRRGKLKRLSSGPLDVDESGWSNLLCSREQLEAESSGS